MTVREWGGIDGLVSNAAVSTSMGAMLDFSEKEWDKIFDVNVRAAFLLAKEAVPHMRPGSSIVFVSSIAGFNPSPFLGIYSVRPF